MTLCYEVFTKVKVISNVKGQGHLKVKYLKFAIVSIVSIIIYTLIHIAYQFYARHTNIYFTIIILYQSPGCRWFVLVCLIVQK